MRLQFRTVDGALFDRDVDHGVWSEGRSSSPVVDLAGGWAVAGMADAHVHFAQDTLIPEPGDPALARQRAFMALSNGVFLCLDKGWMSDAMVFLSDLPPTEAPTVQAAGKMVAGPDGYFPGFATEVDEDGLVEAVRDAAGSARGWVKIVGDWPRKGIGAIPSFSEDALTSAVEVAHRAGCRVAIHTMAPDTPGMAVRAGVDSIEHGLFLTDDDLRLLGERGGAWVPTIVRVEEVIEQVGRERTGGRLLLEGLDRVRSLAGRASDLGVHVLAGSDLALPALEIGREAVALARMGFTIDTALAAATNNAYRYLGLAHGFDVETPADLVVFEHDPREDLSTLLHPMFVMRHGKILRDHR